GEGSVLVVLTPHATISGLTIRDGRSGILNGSYFEWSPELQLNECVICYNHGEGGIVNFGSLIASNCAIFGNSGESGAGGLWNFTGSVAQLVNTTISGNYGEGGGGIRNEYWVNLINCTIADNDAKQEG